MSINSKPYSQRPDLRLPRPVEDVNLTVIAHWRNFREITALDPTEGRARR